jgi:hypothetical protein
LHPVAQSLGDGRRATRAILNISIPRFSPPLGRDYALSACMIASSGSISYNISIT